MGRFIVLPGVNPPSSRPKIDTLDPILPAQGALFLTEPAHPLIPWPAGIPANAAAAPNVAAAQAKALLETTSDAAATGTFQIGVPTNPAAVKHERTAKGGVHVITSQTVDPNNSHIQIIFQDLIKQFILDHTTGGSKAPHNFYLSMWGRVTKAGKTGVGNNITYGAEVVGLNTPSTNKLAMLGQANSVQGAGSNAGDSMSPTTVAPFFTSLATGFDWNGTKPTASANVVMRVLGLGTADMYSYTADIRMAKPSRIGYRFYIEDLTASGRTYAQVRAIDYALYTKEVLTAGGRYYGDTFTDPATIA